MIYSLGETAKICSVNPREYLRRVVAADIHRPHTVTLPEPIEMVKVDD